MTVHVYPVIFKRNSEDSIRERGIALGDVDNGPTTIIDKNFKAILPSELWAWRSLEREGLLPIEL